MGEDQPEVAGDPVRGPGAEGLVERIAADEARRALRIGREQALAFQAFAIAHPGEVRRHGFEFGQRDRRQAAVARDGLQHLVRRPFAEALQRHQHRFALRRGLGRCLVEQLQAQPVGCGEGRGAHPRLPASSKIGR
jgi:hypothetical protein